MRSALSLLLVFLLLLSLASCQGVRRPGEGEILVEFLDVGQADATLVRTKNTTILIDTGDAETGERVLKHLKAAGITEIDCLVLSHAHNDHIGGAASILSALEVGACLMPNDTHDTPEFRALLSALKAEDCRVIEAYRGVHLTYGEIDLRILGPSPYTPLDENARSVALRLTYRDNSFLFMGDCGIKEEEEILSVYDAESLASQVLKVGHHGSKSATGDAFLAAVSPQLAVVSCGRDNSYGFPSAALLSRLSSAGCRVHRTDTDGTCAVIGDGREVTVVK